MTGAAAGPGVRAPFGVRLGAAVAARGRLCVGIDPHPGLLQDWGLSDDPAGLERFALTCVQALGDTVAVVKPQVAFFERHGSAGLAVLERTIAEARAAGALVLADAKRGDIGSTMAAYAEAWLAEGSPLAADAVTLSPFLGVGSLDPALDLAIRTGRGAFVLALTSNPEGAAVQRAVDPRGRTVAQGVVDAIAARNAATVGPGSFGLVVGATVGAHGLDLSRLDGPVLAPGVGAQGAGAAELREVFGPDQRAVLPSTSRGVLRHGPDVASLRTAASRAVTELTGGRPGADA